MMTSPPGTTSIFRKTARVEDAKAKESELLKKVGLEGRGGDRVRTYSHGMRQRLVLPSRSWESQSC